MISVKRCLICIVINLLFILFININEAYSQDKVNVGIMPFVSNNKNQSEIVVAQLTHILKTYNFIQLVERLQMQAIINEIQFSMTGLINEDSALQQGKLLGVTIIIFGTIDKNNMVSARAVHTETGKIIASGTQSMHDLDMLGKNIAYGVESYLARENLKKMRNDSPDIKVNFWIETKEGRKINLSEGLKIGQSIKFKFTVNISGYVTIVDIQPTGDVIILFPNQFILDNTVVANTVYSIPKENDLFEIIVTEPIGEDTITLFFTKQKVDWLDMKKLQGRGFNVVEEKERLAVTRGFCVMGTQLNNKEWESVVISVNVKK